MAEYDTIEQVLQNVDESFARRIERTLEKMNDARWEVFDETMRAVSNPEVMQALVENFTLRGSFDVLAEHGVKEIPTYDRIRHIFDPPTPIPFMPLRTDSDEYAVISLEIYSSKEAKMRNVCAKMATMLAGAQAGAVYLYPLIARNTVQTIDSAASSPVIYLSDGPLSKIRSLLSAYSLTVLSDGRVMRPLPADGTPRACFDKEQVVSAVHVLLAEMGHMISRDTVESVLKVYPQAGVQ